MKESGASDKKGTLLRRNLVNLVLSIGFIILESFQVSHSYEAIELIKSVISSALNGLLLNIFLCAMLEFSLCSSSIQHAKIIYCVYAY